MLSLVISVLFFTEMIEANASITNSGFNQFKWGMTSTQILRYKSGRLITDSNSISLENPSFDFYGIKIESIDFWMGTKGLRGIAIQLKGNDFSTIMRTLSSNLGKSRWQNDAGYNWLVGNSVVNVYPVGVVILEYIADPNQFIRLSQNRATVKRHVKSGDIKPIADMLFKMLGLPYFVEREGFWHRNYKAIVNGLTAAGYNKGQIKNQLLTVLRVNISSHREIRGIVESMWKAGLITEDEEIAWMKTAATKNFISGDVSEYINKLTKSNKDKEAFALLIRACDQNPCAVDYSNKYLKLFIRQNQQKAAFRYLEKCMMKWPNDNALIRKTNKTSGYLYFTMREYSKSAICFEKVINDDGKSNSYLYIDLGKAYLLAGNYVAAKDAFKKYLEFNPKALGYYYKFITIFTTSKHASLRDGEMALSLSKQLINYYREKNRQPFIGYRGLAQSYAELNDFKNAIAAQNKAIDLLKQYKVKSKYEERKKKYISELNTELVSYKNKQVIRVDDAHILKLFSGWYD